MIILFDVGNTSIYTGLSNGTNIDETFRMNTDIHKSPDEYFVTLKSFIDPNVITGVIIGSVVPLVTQALIALTEKYLKLKPVVIEPGTKTGIFVKADNPREVGADLIANAAGLDNPHPTLIIDLGTANKLIYVKNQMITGVIIAPGLQLSIHALDGNTALLHEVDIKVPKKYLGNNTIHCIQSGVVYGTIVMIEGMFGRIREEVGEDFDVIITGGLSSLILEHIRLDIKQDKELVLKGLLNIYKKNIK
ncbi:type III pantothenate kinase [Acholeplasma laidlawii]|uniref:Type III pantothenate kinase n=2 Tax=Acholeplasma laidlawii TaxID=2148 RepID=COAX_ACHLI|nr:type III pantothenate kinase [Acholeplasma laidlawii]A9NGI4.1 RecName: Full=Type III pantothenate kinase; AltName: Full=PanK-III; AltName: Full=Pantothenic acid kinase [Acholeplasma laidlawii PG-8A]ABX81464.1 Bgv accessory factor (Baf) family protein [Acholeplasma laidlawii PG-8A]NWH09962.1 type III pantothenate kinase [Acholeplasma laidlawii]NWH11352.1 type III pantothenate kinase [Acholeplasma laidlawii]NWH13238.1 type III pantothenate kinase [Acholeplasma laidlawii]NWH15129.1 type III p